MRPLSHERRIGSVYAVSIRFGQSSDRRISNANLLLSSRSPNVAAPRTQGDNVTAPGWYPDPCGDGTERYWDGNSWGPSAPPPAAPPATPPLTPIGVPVPIRRKKSGGLKILLVIGGVLLAVWLFAGGHKLESSNSSSPSSSTAEKTKRSSEATAASGSKPAGLVERKTWTDGPWPFTVDYAILNCSKGAEGDRVTVDANREMYALNGAAKSAHQFPAFDPIWSDDPKTPGVKVSIVPMVLRGLALCER
jgi:hypothetical protein